MGPLERRDEEDPERTAVRHQVRHRVDDAGRVPRTGSRNKGIATNIASFVGATTVREPRAGLCGSPAHGRGAGAHAGARAPGHGGGRAGRRLRPHLRARLLREDRRAGGAVRRKPGSYGGMYISHMRSEGNTLFEAVDELIGIAQCRARARRDLPPQGGGQGELAEARTCDRQGRLRARARPAHHGRHVHVHGRRDRAGCGDAALGAGRRPAANGSVG